MTTNKQTKTNAEKIPFHTRFALRLIQILIILLAIVLIQRCLAIYQETKPAVDQSIMQEYYQKGFEAGKNKAQDQEINIISNFEKYSYKKAYRDGYRNGWDQKRAKNNK